MKKLKRLRLAGFQQLSASEEAQTLGGNNSNTLAGIIVENNDGTLIYSYDGDSSKINLNNQSGLSSISGFSGGNPGMFNAFSAGDSGFPVNYYPYIGYGNGLSGGYAGHSGGYVGYSGGQSGGTYYPIYSGGYYGIGYSGGFGVSGYGGSGGVGGGYSGGNWAISGFYGTSGYSAGVKYYF